MLSTMTTSESFQSRCAYRTYVPPSTLLSFGRAENPSTDYQQWSSVTETSDPVDAETFDFDATPSIICNSITVSGGGLVLEQSDAKKQEMETDLTELMDHLELDDFVYDQSKPLRIDPNVFKLDFSNLSNHDRTGVSDRRTLDQFENKRASHHLSGGGLVTDSSEECSKNRFSGGALITNEVFNLNDGHDFRLTNNFFNQISPSSPLTFDLTPRSEAKNVTSRISEAESTNPFRNFMKDALDEEDGFASTNPFTDFSSSLTSGYENVSPQQKSPSQCSTRPASPITKIPDESSSSSNSSSVSNPFLLNRASPEPRATLNIPQFFINENGFQTSPLPNSSPLIFAVPVFQICQHSITNSSTQTNSESAATTTTTTTTTSTPPEPESSVPEPKPVEPVYQNVTTQLRKFIERNDHSEYDLQCLKTTVKDLRDSGWYYENVSWQESVVLLRNTEPGTFLIRDSSDPNFLFSLSVQTSRGPTSVRLHYVNGQFRLDAEEKLIPHMPSFNSVVELIDYYIENTAKNKFANKVKKSSKKNGKSKLQKSKEQVWIDSQGNIYSNILLVRPLHKKEHFSTLQHLARLTVNKHLKKQMNTKVKMNFRVTPVYESSPFQDCSFPNNFDSFCPVLSIDSLPLPPSLIEYLKDYPYCH